jgi:hypothetical protein
MDNKYQNSAIYKIVSKDISDTSTYVGSSVRWRHRRNCHKSDCNNDKSKNYNYKVYQYIRQNGGWDNFEVVKIEGYPCKTREELALREGFWQRTLKATLIVAQAGRTNKACRQDHKERLYELQKKYVAAHKDEVAEYSKLYRVQNKAILNAKQNVKHDCECGGRFTQANKALHLKTKVHINFQNIIN